MASLVTNGLGFAVSVTRPAVTAPGVDLIPGV